MRPGSVYFVRAMANKSHFTPELFKFLKELKRHNDRDWFLKNKKRFEETVRNPFLQFIADLGPLLHGISPSFTADPRPSGGSLFRIYRDVRFSSDKSPYKTHVAAQFTHVEGTKGSNVPGFYLHLEPEGSFAAGGVWHPAAPTLMKIRTAIVKHPDDWRAVRRAKINIEGERLSRPPRGFDPEHPFIEDLKLKDFVTSATFTDKEVCSPRFIIDFAAKCSKMTPLLKFLATSLELDW